MVCEILDRAALPAKGARLIDLACGPGRLTFAIAEHFAEGVAIDLEPKMIAAARLEAERRGVRHIHWSVGRVEDLEAPAGAFDLVTAASAFHRFDQPRVAALAYRWLKPGGALVTLGETPAMAPRANWRSAVTDLVHTYVGEPVQRLQGAPNPTPEEGLAHEEQGAAPRRIHIGREPIVRDAVHLDAGEPAGLPALHLLRLPRCAGRAP
jgi:SAM-dependent methyltransferase